MAVSRRLMLGLAVSGIFAALDVTLARPVFADSKGQEPQRSVSGYQLVPRSLREEVFERSGLTSRVRDLDEMDRDRLIMSIAGREPHEVQKRFPSLPLDRLKVAQRLIREAGWGRRP